MIHKAYINTVQPNTVKCIDISRRCRSRHFSRVHKADRQ